MTGSSVGPNSVELAPSMPAVAGGVDHRHLHAEADAEIGHVAVARKPGGADLALGAALAEAAGHEDAMHVLEIGGGVLAARRSATRSIAD